jgi:hypothetical protein
MLGHKNPAEVGPDRMAWPEEFDRAVLLLTGEAASFVRGAICESTPVGRMCDYERDAFRVLAHQPSGVRAASMIAPERYP